MFWIALLALSSVLVLVCDLGLQILALKRIYPVYWCKGIEVFENFLPYESL